MHAAVGVVARPGAGRNAAACSAPAPLLGSCTLNLPANTADGDAIRAVVHAEGQLVVDQKIDELMALWADGAFVANAKNTPDNPDDDQYWRDKDAIRHRYVRTVFPGAPKQANPADLQITVDGTHAEVRSTTQIGGEVSPAGDRWHAHQAGRLLAHRQPDLQLGTLDLCRCGDVGRGRHPAGTAVSIQK